MANKVISHKIQAGVDDHVFIMVEREGRPTVSLDLFNEHGRSGLSVRANGMGIASVLTDVKELPPAGKAFHRYCPFCGEAIKLFLSSPHVCSNPEDRP